MQKLYSRRGGAHVFPLPSPPAPLPPSLPPYPPCRRFSVWMALKCIEYRNFCVCVTGINSGRVLSCIEYRNQTPGAGGAPSSEFPLLHHKDCHAIQNSCFPSWRLLEPPGASWRLLGPPGASWSILEPSGASWSLLEPPGASWWLLEPPGASWSILGPPGACWSLLEPAGACWSLLGPPGASNSGRGRRKRRQPTPRVCSLHPTLVFFFSGRRRWQRSVGTCDFLPMELVIFYLWNWSFSTYGMGLVSCFRK